jgi:hypothetical protein
MLFLIIGFELLLQFIKSPQPIFEAQTIDDKISIGYGVALGDVDGDSKPDILLADKNQFVWYRNGDWKKFVMIENLTVHDNVCIAARDITGDGKVEVAVGAQWNPAETGDDKQSGSVHYLIRPEDPTQQWKAIELPHVPTIHRMKWVKSSTGKYYLVVVPLHGRGNKQGEGEGVKILVYPYPENVSGQWPFYTWQNNMHLTHNFDMVESNDGKKTGLYLAGKEGVRFIQEDFEKNSIEIAKKLPGMEHGAGEIKVGNLTSGDNFIATIEPMHGEQLVIYLKGDELKRIVIDADLKEGHALAAADFLGTGSDQVVVGWRVPNKDGKTGIKLYSKKNSQGTVWESYWIDENGIACEDIQVMDLNGDGKPDIVASGRATKNLKIYWNKSAK